MGVNPDAEVALFLAFIENKPGRYILFECSCGRTGTFTEQTREFTSPNEIQVLGLDIDLDPESQQVTKIDLGKEWLTKHNCQLIGLVDGVFLLRKFASH